MAYPSPSIEHLRSSRPHQGMLSWIGLRSLRKSPMLVVSRAEVSETEGLLGDVYAEGTGEEHISLIQGEHLACIASFLNKTIISPEMLQRNLVVRGINLLSLKDRQFRIGEVVLEYSGPCLPSLEMESLLGEGGYQAMQGHGGITARVVKGGWIHIGNPIEILPVRS